MSRGSNLVAWMGWRYLTASSSGYSKLVNVISLIGLVLGIALVIVVSSVHNGLSTELQSRLLSVVPHAFVPDSELEPNIKELLEDQEGVDSVQPTFKSIALLQGSEQQITTEVQGISLGSQQVQRLDLLEGDLGQLQDSGIALTASVVSTLRVAVGDRIRVMFVEPSNEGIRARSSIFTLVAVFTTGTEYDANMSLISLDSILDNQLSNVGHVGWRIEVTQPMQVEEVLQAVPSAVTWVDIHGETFRAFQFERIAMYLVMTLVLMVASFNIISGQAMLINVKRGDIAILNTLGLQQRDLARVLLFQGGSISLLGIVLGIVVGVFLAANVGYLFDLLDALFGVAILEGSLFHELPTDISVMDALVGSAIALLLCVFALLKPLKHAFKESPVTVLNRTR